ncbi:FAD-binding protein [Streptomyces sp. 900105245]
MRVDATARTATVGAGLTQLEAVTALAAEDLAVTTGTEGSVGLAGATLGGGFGFLTRYLGMACDNLTGAEIVVADGTGGAEVLHTDLENHSDLLWALRGAGNGNFSPRSRIPSVGRSNGTDSPARSTPATSSPR